MTEPQSVTNYVDNKEFYRLLVARRAQVRAIWDGDAAAVLSNKVYKEMGRSIRISHALGKIILDIATNLSYRRNFINYSFREDMAGDGVENCLVYIDNFNPDLSTNPFAYFTQICFFAFVRRIAKENKQWDGKKKMIARAGVDWDAYARNEFDIGTDYFIVNPDPDNT